MDKKVTVLTPNGRRQNVKVTPNTTLLQILEEACQKHGFESDEYSLKHHNKEVGLTQLFRFSGLPNNCLLEMSQTEKKRVQSNVDICVVLEDGARLKGQFKPADNLWHVVEELIGAETLAGYGSPVLLCMRQEFVGKEAMSSATLKSLGFIQGGGLMRLIDRNPEELKTQANVYIPPVAKESPKPTSDKTASSPSPAYKKPSNGGFAITQELVKTLKQSTEVANANTEETVVESVEADQKEASSETASKEHEKPKYDWGTGSGRTMCETTNTDDAARETSAADESVEELKPPPEYKIIGEHNAILYSMDTVSRENDDLPDSFYDLTVEDLTLVLRDIKRTVTGDENKPLLTEKMRELEDNKTMLNKIGQYKNCIIRVLFPDRLVLQGIFKPIDKMEDVHAFVIKFLQNQEAKFDLFTIPPKTVLGLDKTLLELDFVPTAMLYFAWEEPLENGNDIFIKPEFVANQSLAAGAFYAAKTFRNANRSPVRDEANNNLTAAYERKSPGPSTGAIPKRRRSDNQMKN